MVEQASTGSTEEPPELGGAPDVATTTGTALGTAPDLAGTAGLDATGLDATDVTPVAAGAELVTGGGPTLDQDGVPTYYQRPRSRNRVLDSLLDVVYNVVGPATTNHEVLEPSTPVSAEALAAGYGEWDRVTTGTKTYLVARG